MDKEATDNRKVSPVSGFSLFLHGDGEVRLALHAHARRRLNLVGVADGVVWKEKAAAVRITIELFVIETTFVIKGNLTLNRVHTRLESTINYPFLFWPGPMVGYF